MRVDTAAPAAGSRHHRYRLEGVSRIENASAINRMAALAFWVAAVLFVANVAVLNDWAAAVPAAPEAAASEGAASEEPTGPTTITLDSGATVEFPQPPTRSEQVLDVAGSAVTLVLHSAQGLDGATYNLGTIEYPEQVNLSDPTANLFASASGAAGNVGGAVEDQEIIVFQGAAAVTFGVDTEDVHLVARHVLHGRRLYAQNVAFRGDTEPPDAAAFFASFVLPPTGPSAPASDGASEASEGPTFAPTELPLSPTPTATPAAEPTPSP